MWEYSMSLYHHGIPGMHWGERRYQYDDGTLTPAGKLRYYGPERRNDRQFERSHITSLDPYTRGKILREAGADKRGRTEVVRGNRIARGYGLAGGIGGLATLVGAHSIAKKSDKIIDKIDDLWFTKERRRIDRLIKNTSMHPEDKLDAGLNSFKVSADRIITAPERSQKLSRNIKIGGAVIAAGLVAYGGYKFYSSQKQGRENAKAIQEYERRKK